MLALLSKSYVAKKCGHATRKKGTRLIFERKIKIEVIRGINGEIPFCLNCLAEMSARCARCGEPIVDLFGKSYFQLKVINPRYQIKP